MYIIKHCKNCGNLLNENAKFCDRCGAKVEPDYISVPNNSTFPDSAQRQQCYEGAIHKCPNCGALIDSYTLKCPKCGYEVRGAQSGHPIQALSEKLQRARSEQEKSELISTFYIPNTKEDIYDFLILAVSLAGDTSCNEAWNAKLEQAYLKAKITLKSSSDFKEIQSLYKKAKKAHGKAAGGKFLKKYISGIITLVLMLTGLFLTVFGFMAGEASEDPGSAFFAMGGIGVGCLVIGFLLGITSLSIAVSKSNR